MATYRPLPSREHVFALSLLYHGYRFVRRTAHRKKRYGYIITATAKEDSGGIDFWIKMPGETVLVPVQITQRGVALYKKHDRPSAEQLALFVRHREQRLRQKRSNCKRSGIAFVLVRDYDGWNTSRSLAWGDIKSLRYWMQRR